MAVSGSIDSVAFDCLRGWCWDDASPRRPCPVSLEVDGTVLATALAKPSRLSLRPAAAQGRQNRFEIPVAEDLLGVNLRVTADEGRVELPICSRNRTTTILLARQRCGTNGLRSCLHSHPEIRCYNEIFDPQDGRRSAFDGNFAELVNATDDSLVGIFYPFFEKMLNRYGAARISSADAFLRLVAGLRLFAPVPHILMDVKYNSIKNVRPHWVELGAPPYFLWLVKDQGWNILHLTRRNYLETYVSGLMANQTGTYVLQKDSQAEPPPMEPVHVDGSDLLDTFARWRAEDDLVSEWFAGYERYRRFDYAETFQEGAVSEAVRASVADLLGVENRFDPVPGTRKIVERRLSDVCANYGEIVSLLEKTDFAYCLEPAAASAGEREDEGPARDGTGPNAASTGR